jgi:hypothetical protein
MYLSVALAVREEYTADVWEQSFLKRVFRLKKEVTASGQRNLHMRTFIYNLCCTRYECHKMKEDEMGGHVAREERRETYTNLYYTLYKTFGLGT